MKKDARDLFGLIDFLRYKPYCDFPTYLWKSLVMEHKHILKYIFRTLALRHTKQQVKGDLQLPPQRRVVVTVPFTQIEEQNYATLFGQMTEDCGLNLDGTPRADDWDPNSPHTIEKMRNWLIRLRQTCLHPEIGIRNRRALGGKGPLRTVGEVLEVMLEQNQFATRSEERSVRWSDNSYIQGHCQSRKMYFKCTKGFHSIAYAPRSQRAVSSLCSKKEHANS